nr:hypothetical protein [Campylobacter fetus]
MICSISSSMLADLFFSCSALRTVSASSFLPILYFALAKITQPFTSFSSILFIVKAHFIAFS